MSRIEQPGDRQEPAERSKVMLGRGVESKRLWWRVTVYVGDRPDELDLAVDEALRLDERLRGLA